MDKTQDKTSSPGGSRQQPYHHGDLHNALMTAAEAELIEKGVEGFTLRGCAKRAGVSHAAPAHHFRDATGLLTALAADGFRRFVAALQRRRAAAPADPNSRLAASGLAYVDFATANPALFRLMFSSQRPDFSDAALQEAAAAAFNDLVACVAAIRGRDPRADKAAMVDVLAAWATVHGLADLLMSQRAAAFQQMPADERDRTLEDIIRRSVP